MPFSNLSLGWSRQLLRGGRGACAAGEIYIFEAWRYFCFNPLPLSFALCFMLYVCTRHTGSQYVVCNFDKSRIFDRYSFLPFLFLYNSNEKFVSTTRFLTPFNRRPLGRIEFKQRLSYLNRRFNAPYLRREMELSLRNYRLSTKITMLLRLC